MIAIEFIHDYINKKGLYSLKDSLQTLLLLYTFAAIYFTVQFGVKFLDPFLNQYLLPVTEKGWIFWISLTVIYDFLYYWMHRLEHTPFLWKISHIHHHSSRYLNILTGFRSSIFQPVYLLLFIAPLYLLGFRTPEIFFMVTMNKLYNCWVHQQHLKKVPLVDLLLNSPANHRVHHGRNEIYIDRNFAGIFMIWDKLFGTYQEETEKVLFGVSTDPEKLKFFQVYTLGFLRAIDSSAPKAMVAGSEMPTNPATTTRMSSNDET